MDSVIGETMSTQGEEREDLERVASKLDVPFAVVQAGSDANWDAARQEPNLDQLADDIRREVEPFLAAAGFTELVRLAFYYASRVPFTVPNEVPSWTDVLAGAANAAGGPVWRIPIIDGLPDPANATDRLLTARTGAALHDIRALWRRHEPTGRLPTFRTANLRTCPPRNGGASRLVIFHHRPETIWNWLSDLLNETGFCPDFLVRSDPPLGETVAGMSYVQRGDDSRCIETRVHDDGVGYTQRECELVETPGFEWTAVAHGPSLGRAIINAFDLDRQLPHQDTRMWPAESPEHPKDWLVREMSDDMPRYPNEPIEYRHGAERLAQDRWLFWTWQCGRWRWLEIDPVAKEGRVLIRRKVDSGPSSDRESAYRGRAKAYAAWVGLNLRPGRQ